MTNVLPLFYQRGEETLEITNARRRKTKFLTVYQNMLEPFLIPVLYKSYTGITEETDMVYDEGGKRTKLDIIVSDNPKNESRPLFIYIHGGGWTSGLRKVRKYYCRYWASNGFVCANIGYDYGVDAAHPESIRQIFKGIEYVLEMAEFYNIDTSRIVLAGESAGAHLAALCAAASVHKELFELLKISFRHKDSFDVSACVLLSGIYDPIRAMDTGFPGLKAMTCSFCRSSVEELRKNADELRKTLAPSYYADEKFPPSFIIGSDKDFLLPESETFHKELTAAGANNEYFVCGGLHGVHAGALACHIGPGKKAAERALSFVKEAFCRNSAKN